MIATKPVNLDNIIEIHMEVTERIEGVIDMLDYMNAKHVTLVFGSDYFEIVAEDNMDFLMMRTKIYGEGDIAHHFYVSREMTIDMRVKDLIAYFRGEKDFKIVVNEYEKCYINNFGVQGSITEEVYVPEDEMLLDYEVKDEDFTKDLSAVYSVDLRKITNNLDGRWMMSFSDKGDSEPIIIVGGEETTSKSGEYFTREKACKDEVAFSIPAVYLTVASLITDERWEITIEADEGGHQCWFIYIRFRDDDGETTLKFHEYQRDELREMCEKMRAKVLAGVNESTDNDDDDEDVDDDDDEEGSYFGDDDVDENGNPYLGEIIEHEPELEA